MDRRAFREDPQLLALAREMRRDPAPAEKKLWRMVRDRKLGGFKFRRQVPIDRYIADFLCVECRLVLELDGPSHQVEGAPESDAERTAYLEKLGFHVLRLKNTWVHDNPEAAKKLILEVCEKRCSHSHDASRSAPHPSPLP